MVGGDTRALAAALAQTQTDGVLSFYERVAALPRGGRRAGLVRNETLLATHEALRVPLAARGDLAGAQQARGLAVHGGSCCSAAEGDELRQVVEEYDLATDQIEL